ncbi:cytochrome C [Salipiger aestuarii]|nr:cytochrome C [Salipiger aestuarii]
MIVALSPNTRKRVLVGGVSLAALGVVGFLALTSPLVWSLTHPDRDVADNTEPDLDNGRAMFVIGDCATCHVSPGAENVLLLANGRAVTPNQDDQLLLGGGRVLETEFGAFHMPNISPHPEDGIGAWSLAEFTRAMREGVGPDGLLPDGRNLYPAFPYTSYQRMTANDVRDMFAYIQTLEPVASDIPDHDLKFPYNIRRGVGVWRLAFLDGQPIEYSPSTEAAAALSVEPDVLERGHYLVEGPGHCAECHSPRTFMGTIPQDMRYAGGANPEGTGYFPNITPDETGIGFWSANSIANYLRTGISPINKVAGGDMADVVHNTAQISDADRFAMGAYMKTVPAIDKPAPGMPEPNLTPEIVMLPPSATQVPELPTSGAGEIEAAETVYVAHTKTFFIDKAAVGTADGDGKLLGATELAVVDREDGRLKVRLDGWQMPEAERVFYAEQGHRILQAILGDASIEQVSRQESMVDPDTQQEWARSSLEVWIDDKDMSTELSALWDYSADLYNASCGTCHALPVKDHYLANQWIGNLNSMRRFTSLGDDQYRLLLAYLQNHSKDVTSRDPGAVE